MSFADHALNKDRPDSITRDVTLPRRQRYFASPSDWRDEVLYFLLVDRFSDEIFVWDVGRSSHGRCWLGGYS